MSDLVRITLLLDRNPAAGLPDSDPRRGYHLVAPIAPDGALDLEMWRKVGSACTVQFFSSEGPEEAGGLLSYRDGQWLFCPDGGVDRAGAFVLRNHRLVLGQYVTVQESGNASLVYRVADLRPMVD